MKMLVQAVVFVMLLVVLCQLPVSVMLLRFSNGAVISRLETPPRVLEVGWRNLSGDSPLWYRVVNGGLLILDLVLLIGLAAYPAHLVGRSKPGSDSRSS